jgi:hypothetical protein
MQNASDEDIHFRKVTKSEILLITLIVLFSIAAILWNWSGDSKSSKEAGMVAVHQGGKVLQKVRLKEDKIIVLPNGEMKIEVKESKVRVAWSDCPRQLCLNTGWIKTAGEVIVCVPNKVLIEIEATGFPALDAVVR